MKSIHDCNTNERMLRALIIIEQLAGSQDVLAKSEPETPVECFVHDVYCIAHAAMSHCIPHENWLDVADDRAKSLKDANMVDVDKVVEAVYLSQKKDIST